MYHRAVVIKLRRTLERGRAHPVLGPIVLILLVLLLAMVFLHTAIDGHDSATETGMLCIAILTVLGAVILDRIQRAVPLALVEIRGDRGPPLQMSPLLALPGETSFTFAPPLRR